MWISSVSLRQEIVVMSRKTLCLAMLAWAAGAATSASAATPAPDAGLFTSYAPNGSQVVWSTCGSTPTSSGCFSQGTLTGFDRVCALLESDPVTLNSASVMHYLYVVDGRSTKGRNVILDVFKKIDSVVEVGNEVQSGWSVSVQLTLTKSVVLPLTGGGACRVAAGPSYLFLGTSAGSAAARVSKATLGFSSIYGLIGSIAAITADPYGFVSVTANTGQTAANGSTTMTYRFEPNGTLQPGIPADAPGGSILPDTANAFVPVVGAVNAQAPASAALR